MATSTVRGARTESVSVLGAAKWLKANGYRPCSRPAVYAAVWKQELPAEVIAGRLVIRLADLERFAKRKRGGV
jgi:hypothetical protein